MSQHDLFDDRDNSDSDARLLFAEYLDERGDDRAAGYRWMGERAKWPYCDDYYDMPYGWHNAGPGTTPHCGLTWEILEAMDSVIVGGLMEFPTRRAAEEALCRAVTEMR